MAAKLRELRVLRDSETSAFVPLKLLLYFSHTIISLPTGEVVPLDSGFPTRLRRGA